MPTPVTTACQRCHAAIVIEYVLLGSAMQCPHCLQVTVPAIPVGGIIPSSGYALTYRDFRQLIEPGADRAAVEPLLNEWYGATIGAIFGQTVMIGRDGVPIDPLWLHLEIQNNESRQQSLYQLAMTLWH